MILWLSLLACEPEEEDPCPTEPSLTWENFGEGHMRTHCNGCHGVLLREPLRNGAPLGVDFDTYPMVVDWADRIAARTYDGGGMPPLGGPTEIELARFEEWMRCEVEAP